MQPVKQVIETLGSAGLGFERIDHIPGSTYKDNSTAIVVPTRGMIHHRVTQSWLNLIPPMNQKRMMLFASGFEVGDAYNAMIKNILANPELKNWKYLMTLEDDNIIPSDAHVRLLETIEAGPFDGVGGIYFTKGDFNAPMIYGDPAEYERTGVLDFRPRDCREALAAGQVMPCNGIAMGCSLYRMDMFREVEGPWFVTTADVVPGKGTVAMTQDLAWCRRAKMLGKRFAVDLRVRCGHLDVNSGVVY